MTQEALNIAGQCRATASSPLAKNILVDEGNGLLTELLLDAARIIEALAQPEQEPVPVTDNTYAYAKSLAEAIFKQHFSSDEHYASGRIVWGVNDSVIGILTQIDNMVADMVRRPEQPERHELQAKGEHPAPCARFCEANAFQIVIKNLKAQLAQPDQLFEENERLHVENRRLIERIETIGVPVGVGGFVTTTTQPEQEPVAFEEWLSKQHGDPEEIGFLQALRIAYISGQDSITTPPQRKPLTDEEIWKFWWSRPEVPDGEDDSMEAEFVAAVRRVLAAHGIKENT